MAGRRRRASNSTVATVDDRRIRWTRESSLLRPVPNDTHSDDWPCFVLTDAVIYDKTGKLANVLHADLEGPFVVRGYIDVQDKDLFPRLCRPTHRSGYIEIQKSWSYSIGYGPYPVVWASGEAGWFEINPAPQYRAMYDKMCQGITLYYMVMDVYETARDLRKRKKKLSHGAIPLEDIFLQYAVAVGDGVVHDEVIQRCHDHAQFLIGHFPKETNFRWSGTTFYKWITSEHPDLRERLADMSSGASDPKPTSSLQPGRPSPQEDDPSAVRLPGITRKKSYPPLRRSSSNLDVEMADATPDHFDAVEHKGEKMSRLSSQHLQLAESILDEDRDQETSASTSAMEVMPNDEQPLLDILKSILRDLATEVNPHQAKPSQVPNKIFFMCRIKAYPIAKDIIRYFCKDLAKDLPQEWHGTPFEAWLEAEASKPYEPLGDLKPEDIRRQLQRRQKKPITAPVRREAVAPPRRTEVRGMLRNDDTVEAMETDIDRQPRSSKRLQPPMVGRRSGKQAGLRLVSSSKKRVVDDLDDEESNGSHRGRKSVRTSQSFDDDEGDFEDTNDTSEAMTPFNEDEELNVPAPKEAVRIVIHAERVPTMSPSGPNGTWVCSEPSCGYVVREAEVAESQEIIRSHFLSHEEQAKKINLAVTEGRRGHMPINHLLEKIQRMAKDPSLVDSGTNGDQVFPAPIKRRVLT